MILSLRWLFRLHWYLAGRRLTIRGVIEKFNGGRYQHWRYEE